jgi:uncharacterized membrane protein YhaH (DUF805 family)
MSLFSLLFTFHGRITRAHWWLGMAIVAASAASLIVGVGYLRLPVIPFLPALLLSTYPVFSLGIKRLHDRNMTGWYIAWMTLIPAILLYHAANVTSGSAAWWVLGSSGLALLAWGVAELGVRPGTEGANDYDAAADEAGQAFETID